jgi:hypothetical protein
MRPLGRYALYYTGTEEQPQEYIKLFDGILGETDEGLYSAVPYEPEGFKSLGNGCYRRSPRPAHY